MAAYPKFDPAKPDGTGGGAGVISDVLANMEALLDGSVGGFPTRWDGAVTTPGAQPDVMTLTDSDDTNRKTRYAFTWGSSGGSANKPTVITFERTVDGGTTWTDPETMTITWDASGYYVSHAMTP